MKTPDGECELQTHLKPATALRARRQELKDLEFLDSGHQIQDALARIAGAFGKILSISQLVLSNEYRRPEYVFFINFENAQDAMTAARDLDGLLYGFSAIVIAIPRNGFSRLS